MRYCSLLYFIFSLSILSCNDRSTADLQQKEIANSEAHAANTVPGNPPPKPDSAYLIVPGERVGQIKLGHTAELVNSKLGQPDSGDAAMGKALNFWINPDEKKVRQYVAVYFVRNLSNGQEALQAEQVQVTSPAFQTSDSISTGSSLSNIRTKYKPQAVGYYTNEQQQQVYVYDDAARGIAFEITTPDSVCSAITIHRKDESVSDTYLPIHPDMIRLKE